jgi:hypothetical protein
MQGNLDLDAWQRILAGTPKNDQGLHIVHMLRESESLLGRSILPTRLITQEWRS